MLVTEDRPLVSIVVPTRNSGATIERCLSSLRAQTYPTVEVLVIDNQSTDATWEVATAMADIAIRGGPERSAQRNLGVSRARGRYILWIDSDMELNTDVVDRSVAVALATGAVGVLIAEQSVGQGFWVRCRALERASSQGEVWVEAPRLVLREYLVQSGGFREWLSGTEDAELRVRMLREGCLLARAETLILHHEGRPTLRAIVRKRFYYGRGLSRYRKAHPGAISRQAMATLRAYVRNWREFARHPGVACGVVIMRSAEVLGYLAGAAVGSVRPPDH